MVGGGDPFYLKVN